MIKSRITILLIGVVGVILCFSGCMTAISRDYYNELEDYETIWSLPGFRHGYEGVSEFFPQSLDGLTVQDYLCRYDQFIPVGEGVQVYLEILYEDENIFMEEVERLSEMGFECTEQFEGTGFLAYATRMGESYDSEYALIDEENNIIYYIYLSYLLKEDVAIDEQFIPRGYYDWGYVDMDLSETE